jgi:hypothetical protein
VTRHTQNAEKGGSQSRQKRLTHTADFIGSILAMPAGGRIAFEHFGERYGSGFSAQDGRAHEDFIGHPAIFASAPSHDVMDIGFSAIVDTFIRDHSEHRHAVLAANFPDTLEQRLDLRFADTCLIESMIGVFCHL